MRRDSHNLTSRSHGPRPDGQLDACSPTRQGEPHQVHGSRIEQIADRRLEPRPTVPHLDRDAGADQGARRDQHLVVGRRVVGRDVGEVRPEAKVVERTEAPEVEGRPHVGAERRAKGQGAGAARGQVAGVEQGEGGGDREGAADMTVGTRLEAEDAGARVVLRDEVVLRGPLPPYENHRRGA